MKTQRWFCARESLDTHEAQLAGRFALAVGHLRDEKLEIRRVGSTHCRWQATLSAASTGITLCLTPPAPC